MPTCHYHSNDASAPTLTSDPGSLIALLDACLINGYGSKTAPGGWTRPYSGTNKAVYRNDAVYGSGRYLRVDDSGYSSPVGKVADIKTYLAMTDVDTGTGPFFGSGGNLTYWYKSESASGVAVSWDLYADERFFYLFTRWDTSQTGVYEVPCYFGDLVDDPILPFKSTVVAGSANSALVSVSLGSSGTSSLDVNGTASYGLHICVNSGGTYGDYVHYQGTDAPIARAATAYITGMSSFNEPEGVYVQFRLGKVYVATDVSSSTKFSGYLPGLYSPTAIPHISRARDTVSGVVGGLSEKTFMYQRCGAGLASNGCTLIDLGNWRA